MRKNIVRTLLLTVLFLCIACAQQKTHVSQLIFNENITRAYLNEVEFSGEAWSDDGKSIRIVFTDGDVKFIEVYHDNGNVALHNTKLSGVGKSYDKEGNPITMEEFVIKYPELVQQVQLMINSMLCSPELK